MQLMSIVYTVLAISYATVQRAKVVECSSNTSTKYKSNDVEEARFFPSNLWFPFLPQFYDVNYGTNLEFLTNSDTISTWVIRDATQTAAVSAFWILVHSILWNGRIERDSSLPFPLDLLSSSFGAGDLSDKSSNSKTSGLLSSPNQYAEDKLNSASLNEIPLNNLINFVIDPKSATNSLLLGLGFVFFSSLVWLFPTFFWTGTALPERRQTDEAFNGGPHFDFSSDISAKVDTIVERLGSSQLTTVYNEILCPVCIARYLIIIGVCFTGRMIFWAVMALLPKQWPNIFFNPLAGGLSISKKRSFSANPHPPSHNIDMTMLETMEVSTLYWLDIIDERIAAIGDLDKWST